MKEGRNLPEPNESIQARVEKHMIIKFLLAWAFRFRRKGIPGIGRIARRLTRNELFPSVKSKSTLGLSFYSNPADAIDQIMLRTGEYEPHVLRAIQMNLQPQDVFWDIGCNVGYHSISIRQLFPNIEIYAFEPNPVIFARLWANINLNAKQIKIFNFGLATRSSFAELSIQTHGNSGLSSFMPLEAVDYDRKLFCPVFSGDDLILNNEVQAPNVIKIDVEGFEASVFRGMSNALKNINLRAIIFEARGFKKDDDLADLLVSFGFTEFTALGANLDWLAKRPSAS